MVSCQQVHHNSSGLLGCFFFVVMNGSKTSVVNRLFPDLIHQGLTPQIHDMKVKDSFPFSLWVMTFVFSDAGSGVREYKRILNPLYASKF